MSRKTDTLTIYPPEGMSYPIARQEKLESEVFRCPVCKGMCGRHYDQHDEGGERWEPCSMCEGSGKVIANITLDWVSYGEAKEILNE